MSSSVEMAASSLPAALAKQLAALLCTVAVATLCAGTAGAQGYPAKPVRIVVGYSPGGGTDTTARSLAQKLSDHLGQSVIVENRPGASGSIALERVARAPADGYTLLMLTSNETVLPALRKNLAFDLQRDFAAVSLVTIGPMVLVTHPSLPAKNVKDLVALAKSHSHKLTFASSGIGGTPHLAGELFAQMAKVKLVHVAYKGGADAVVAAASGEVGMSFASVTAGRPLVDAGRLKALAVTSAKRVSSMPAIPTLDEAGLRGYDYSAWYGVAAPAGAPQAVIARLNADIGKAVNTPEMKELLARQGLEPQTNTAEQFAAMVRSEIVQSARLVAASGASAE
ncbi:MAG: tripartite tricarboxylate transporter substrate binding protein [Burkholderiales bacterium]|nr:tripartite tricarboxylate transporter substrate binding protein [Burkholderiales bacterium]